MRDAWNVWNMTKEQYIREKFLDRGVRELRQQWRNNRKILLLRLFQQGATKHRRDRLVKEEFILRSQRRTKVNVFCALKKYMVNNDVFRVSNLAEENEKLETKLKVMEAEK